jgi:hypothetical protein
MPDDPCHNLIYVPDYNKSSHNNEREVGKQQHYKLHSKDITVD